MNNTDGIMGLSLIHVGLLVATGLLLTIVLSFVFFNEWEQTAELQSQASGFSSLLSDVDASFFEKTSRFKFSHTEYRYSVSISTQYVIIQLKGSWGGDLVVTKKLLISPWPRLPDQNWTTGEDLHMFLNRTCGHLGTQNDSIPPENFTQLSEEQNSTISFYALHPLEIQVSKPVYIEKITIFYNQTKKHDFLLLYQTE